MLILLSLHFISVVTLEGPRSCPLLISLVALFSRSLILVILGYQGESRSPRQFQERSPGRW